MSYFFFLIFLVFVIRIAKMVSLLHISCLTLLMLIVGFVQSEPVVETSNDVHSSKTSMTNEQLYELYKVMRTDPRLASVSNQEIVAYIYRNFVLGKTNPVDYIKEKYLKQRHHQQQQQKINPVE